MAGLSVGLGSLIMAFLDAKPPLLQRLCCCVAAVPQRQAWTMFGTPLRLLMTPPGRSNMRELLALAIVEVGVRNGYP